MLVGVHKIHIKLQDNSGDTADGKVMYERTHYLYAEYTVTVRVEPKAESESGLVGESEREDRISNLLNDDSCSVNCFPEMHIESVDTLGLMTVVFDRDMVVPVNTSHWTGYNTYLVDKGLQDDDSDFSSISISVLPG